MADQYSIDNNKGFEWSLASAGTHRFISCGNALKSSSVTGNRGHSATAANKLIGIGVGSTNIKFSDNFTNTDILYDSIPAQATEIDVELQNGLFLKVVHIASAPSAFTDHVFANPFPNAIQSAVAVVNGSVTTSANVIIRLTSSNKTKINLAVDTGGPYPVEVWCVGN